jgi:hypothetical protein
VPACLTHASFLLSRLVSHTRELPSLYMNSSRSSRGLPSLYSRHNTSSVSNSYIIYAIIIYLFNLGTNHTTLQVLSRIAFIFFQSVIITTYPSITNIFQISCHESQYRSITTSGPLPGSPAHICISSISASRSWITKYSYFLRLVEIMPGLRHMSRLRPQRGSLWRA